VSEEVDEKNRELVLRVRRAYLRVFDPQLGEKASDEDRGFVLADLQSHANYNTEFVVDSTSPNAALQLAAQEGRRGVYLRIKQAILLGRADFMAEQQKPSKAITE
jgi:hypothetical protein